jgi:hypothetical protein
MYLVEGFKDVIDSFLLFFYFFIDDFFEIIVLMCEAFLQFANFTLYSFLYVIFLDFAFFDHLTRIQNGAWIQTDLFHLFLKWVDGSFDRGKIE